MKGYVRVNVETDVDLDVADVILEIDTEDLIRELKYRKAKIDSIEVNDEQYVVFMPSYKVHRLLCDMFDLSRVSTKEEILNKISESI